jgi:hypothetical protein
MRNSQALRWTKQVKQALNWIDFIFHADLLWWGICWIQMVMSWFSTRDYYPKIWTPEHWNESRTRYPLDHQNSFNFSRFQLLSIWCSKPTINLLFIWLYFPTNLRCLIANFFEKSLILIAFLKNQKLK